ncbi:hypothetical protein [Scytonema hofmannii]|nr:hypothetical protein [Scytonema hofmannii]
MSKPRYGIWIPVYGNCGVMNPLAVEPKSSWCGAEFSDRSLHSQ